MIVTLGFPHFSIEYVNFHLTQEEFSTQFLYYLQKRSKQVFCECIYEGNLVIRYEYKSPICFCHRSIYCCNVFTYLSKIVVVEYVPTSFIEWIKTRKFNNKNINLKPKMPNYFHFNVSSHRIRINLFSAINCLFHLKWTNKYFKL